jgi:Fic family protein
MNVINEDAIVITHEIMQLIAEIDEFKGSWLALGKLAPDKLTALKKVAAIESIGSSTRIEGSKLTDKEVAVLLNNLQLQQFENRDEQEVAGYAKTMDLIFDSFTDIPLTENYIKQLHSYVLQYSEKDAWHKGNFKTSPNNVVAVDENGKAIGVVFETATPFETPMQMEQLFRWTNNAFEQKKIHPLIIIAVFIVWYLAIHPFQDGNGRLSRILNIYLLLVCGYSYVPYASLEAIIEKNKKEYYLALRQTQSSLKNENPNWHPWILFFLKTLATQKNNLLHKIEKQKILAKEMPLLSQKIIEHITEFGRVTISELAVLTQFNRNTIKKHLESLVKQNEIFQKGNGKGTWYEL